MAIQEFIQTLNNPVEKLPNQIKAFVKLRRHGGSAAWWAICRYCYHYRPQIADMSRVAIQKLDDDAIGKILTDLIQLKTRTHYDASVFQVLSEMRLESVLKYLVESIDDIIRVPDQHQILAKWFEETQFYYKVIPLLVELSVSQRRDGHERSPSKVAFRVITALLRVDDQFALHLAQYASQDRLPSIVRVIALGLLEGAPLDNTVLQELIPALQDPDEFVRSKAVKICGHLVASMRVFSQILQDPDARVRANAVESLCAHKVFLDKVLEKFLADSSPRVRANALRLLEEADY